MKFITPYLTPIIVSVAAIVCFCMASNAYIYKYKTSQTITVTGLAEKNFVSDQIVWRGSCSRKNLILQTAYEQLKNDETTIRNYLISKGVKETEIVFSAVSINKEFDYFYDSNGNNTSKTFTGFNLSQNLTVKSAEIVKIETLSREVTELIEKGIEFNSEPPSYYYTKLSELKLDLLAKASADARQRAKIIADNSGNGLGTLTKATMGVFQITGESGDDDYSYGGAFNTSSKNKTASITIKTEYKTR